MSGITRIDPRDLADETNALIGSCWRAMHRNRHLVNHFRYAGLGTWAPSLEAAEYERALRALLQSRRWARERTRARQQREVHP